jgi:hypothetical protein
MRGRDMERVGIRTYREGNSHPKKFGAEYVRSSGERKIIATGQRSSAHARDTVAGIAPEYQWDPKMPAPPFVDVGSAWVDER